MENGINITSCCTVQERSSIKLLYMIYLTAIGVSPGGGCETLKLRGIRRAVGKGQMPLWRWVENYVYLLWACRKGRCWGGERAELLIRKWRNTRDETAYIKYISFITLRNLDKISWQMKFKLDWISKKGNITNGRRRDWGTAVNYALYDIIWYIC